MPDIHASEFTVNGVSWGQPITINWQPLDDSGHVEDDTDDHEECCEDHREWYP